MSMFILLSVRLCIACYEAVLPVINRHNGFPLGRNYTLRSITHTGHALSGGCGSTRIAVLDKGVLLTDFPNHAYKEATPKAGYRILVNIRRTSEAEGVASAIASNPANEDHTESGPWKPKLRNQFVCLRAGPKVRAISAQKAKSHAFGRNIPNGGRSSCR